jgi:glycosyltransferase involved in cell wall biosynthesis
MSKVATDVATTDGKRRPREVDRLIVQQVDTDPAYSIGGIDTCIRGLLEYSPPGVKLALVGIDYGNPAAGHRLGQWETHQRGDRTVFFLPVARLDPTGPKRGIPHSVRLVAGLLRYRRAIPAPKLVQAHRVDVAMAVRVLFRAPLVYSIHTQEHGLMGRTSDSFWRFAGGWLYERIDRLMVRLARRVIVFNPDYAERVRQWNPHSVSAPTWFDPAITVFQPDPPDPYAVLWVGRFEVPKDPQLAVRTFADLAQAHPDEPWTLRLVGDGSLRSDIEAQVAALPAKVRERISMPGRLTPKDLAELRYQCGVFLMTSHAGYEGYPRVLVEALATGLPAVVTEGADTGGLVRANLSGSVHGRDPAALADGLRAARNLDRTKVAEVVSALSAPAVIRQVFYGDDLDPARSAGDE